MCVLARLCSGLCAPGPGPAEVVAAALLHLVCFGCHIFQLICCFCSIFSHCLPVGLPSVAETAPRHCHRKKRGCGDSPCICLSARLVDGAGSSAGRPPAASAPLPLRVLCSVFHHSLGSWKVMGAERMSRCSSPPFFLLNSYGAHNECKMTSYFKNSSPRSDLKCLSWRWE